MPIKWKARLWTIGVNLLVAGLVVAGLSGVGAITTTKKNETTIRPERLLPVLTTRARLQKRYSVRREFVGRVEARRESRVGFELGGMVSKILADEGDLVKAGEVLARLDTQLLEARRAELIASRNQARAELELAEITVTRFRQARKKNAVSSQSLDENEKNRVARKAALEQAESAIRSIDVRIQKSVLVAPFDALVAERAVDEGQVIAAGSPVLFLLEQTNPEVRIGIAGAAVDAIRKGQRHPMNIRNRKVWGTVRSILPIRDRGTRSVDVVLVLNVKFNGIRRGDLARLEIKRNIEEPGFWLPLTALTESSRGLWSVYVVHGHEGESGKLERRELEVLHQEADRVFVRGTLSDSERIVVGGLHRLVPGQMVQITTFDPSSKKAKRGEKS